MLPKILIVEDQFLEANHLRLMLKKAGYGNCDVARSAEEALTMLSSYKPDLVLLDIFLSGKLTGIDLAQELSKAQIGFIYLSASSNEEILNQAKATRPYGFLVKPFREKELLINLQIAAYHREFGIESVLRKEKYFLEKLEQVQQNQQSIQDKLLTVVKAFQPLVPFDFAVAVHFEVIQNLEKVIGFYRIGKDEYQLVDAAGFQRQTKLKDHELEQLAKAVEPAGDVKIYNLDAFDKVAALSPMKAAIKLHYGMRSNLVIPIPLTGTAGTFFFSFFSREAAGFDDKLIELCKRLQGHLSQAFAAMLHTPASHKINTSQDQRIRNGSFDNIIGKSPAILKVFDLVTQVATAGTSVLITGESGTGKESIAEHIHNLSNRRNGPLIKVNCAALPPTLIESTLFGHEKGAFTGASDKRIGKFELANGGSIFLDEIGELPIELQPKLLRALQQRDIERVGGSVPVKVDVRIIAATNRNLEKEVAAGRFRLDLYYRLNVFPIELPPLRERKEDIPLLAQYFLQLYARRNERPVNSISDKALQTLFAWHWPGNIRELENVIERAVLMSRGKVVEDIFLPVGDIPQEQMSSGTSIIKTIEENERDHILSVLRKTGGRIRGSDGAAAILGVPPTTLASKIKKLGISKGFY